MNRRTAKARTQCIHIVIGMALLLPLCGCLSRELQTGLTEQDAQEIVVVLKQSGLEAFPLREATMDRDSAPAWTVKVRGGSRNVLVAWQVLQDNGLPRQKVKGLEDVFANKGMIPTASEEKARMLLALSGELTRTIKTVTGVVDARVQVVLPDNSPLLEKSQWSPTTASVLIKHRGSAPPLTEDEVRSLVARGIEGLQPENVAVVYKRIPAVAAQNYEVGWYLADSHVVLASLGLALLTGLGTLYLLYRSNRQRAAIRALEKDLQKASGTASVRQLEEGARV